MAEHFLERVAERIPLPTLSIDAAVRRRAEARAEAFMEHRGKRLVEEYLQFMEEAAATDEPSA